MTDSRKFVDEVDKICGLKSHNLIRWKAQKGEREDTYV